MYIGYCMVHCTPVSELPQPQTSTSGEVSVLLTDSYLTYKSKGSSVSMMVGDHRVLFRLKAKRTEGVCLINTRDVTRNRHVCLWPLSVRSPVSICLGTGQWFCVVFGCVSVWDLQCHKDMNYISWTFKQAFMYRDHNEWGVWMIIIIC